MSNNPIRDITPDICDQWPEVQVLQPSYQSYGGAEVFYGPIQTVRCYEDNSKVKEVLNTPGSGRVLVVDGGGSLRCALLGDQIAEAAVANAWAGVVIHGCIRDCVRIGELPLGVKALSTHPRKTEKLGRGDVGGELDFGGVIFKPNDWLYADPNGVVVAQQQLDFQV